MTQGTDKTESSTHGDVDMIESSQAWPDSHGVSKFFYGSQELNVKLVPHDSDAKSLNVTVVSGGQLRKAVILLKQRRDHYRTPESSFWRGFFGGFFSPLHATRNDLKDLRYPRDSFAEDQKRIGADMYSAMGILIENPEEAREKLER